MTDIKSDGSVAVGIDLVEVGRIADIMERWGDRFRRRVFTDNEIRSCGDCSESLAARFAAKEAFSKALGTGQSGFNWMDVEVVKESSGRPVLVLHGKARALASARGFDTLAVSLTHTGDVAAAIVALSR